MRRVAIFLRKTGKINKFRNTILNTLRTDIVDNALLCSGFFQHDHSYSAANEFNLLSYRQQTKLTLTVIGIYSYTWQKQYSNFFNTLKNQNTSTHFNAIQKRIKGMQWHAKVFIAKIDKNPVVGIIGSSNITKRAFGLDHRFNHECDVVLWDETIPDIERAVSAAIEDVEFSDVIVTNYDIEHRANQQTLQTRLINLEAEILAHAVDV